MNTPLSTRLLSLLLLVAAVAATGCNQTTLEADQDPVVVVTDPTADAMVEGAVIVAADASDDGEIAKVEFYLGDTLLHTDDQGPWQHAWDSKTVENGRYQIQARAYDTDGNRATSAPVDITCCNKNSKSIEAGPIWSNQDAKGKCPTTCAAADRSWTGHWWTTVPGQMSVCQCTTDCSKL